MSEAIQPTDDLFTHILGLPAGARPPDHYTLLGVDQFTWDRDEIESAVHNRMEQLDEFALHPNSDIRRSVQDMMTQVAQARVCLDNPVARHKYDDQLRRKLMLIYAPADLQLELPAADPTPIPTLVAAPAEGFDGPETKELPAPHGESWRQWGWWRENPIRIAAAGVTAMILLTAIVVLTITYWPQNRTSLSARDQASGSDQTASLDPTAPINNGSVQPPGRVRPPTTRPGRTVRGGESAVAAMPTPAPAIAMVAPSGPSYWDGKESVAQYAQRCGIKNTTLMLDLGNDVKMELALIPPGKFMMGCPDDEKDARRYERPSHQIVISKAFYMGSCPVTQEQYQQVMVSKPSKDKGKDVPVSDVTWDDAASFCDKVSQATGRKVRLPTEAQWEYACRAGAATRFFFGDDEAALADYAWYKTGDGDAKHPVGQKKPNAWGLYDLAGNVGQWCSDLYDSGYYRKSAMTDPTGPSTAAETFRVVRGERASSEPLAYRSAQRQGIQPSNANMRIGFRVMVEAPSPVATTVEPAPTPVATTEPATTTVTPIATVAKPVLSASTDPAYWNGNETIAEYARRRGFSDATLALDLGNGVKMKVTLIPAGKFMMGSPDDAKDREGNEVPQHEEKIAEPFYMGVYEITQEQWTAVMSTTPWKGKSGAKEGATIAAGHISWGDAADFCKTLSAKIGMKVSLPPEEKWEYACRAGSKTRFCYGDDDEYSSLSDYAWYDKNTSGAGENCAHAVGQKKSNAWGLYDMHGNVREWCANGLAFSTANGDTARPTDTSRVMRGGSFAGGAQECRSACRIGFDPKRADAWYGFRVMVEAPEPAATVAVPVATTAPATKPATAPATRPAVPVAADPSLWNGKESVAQYAARRGIKVPFLAVDLGNNVRMNLTLIPAGKFMMGSPDDDRDAGRDEHPRHEVTITKPFYMGVFPVTQEQYEQVMSNNPSIVIGKTIPVNEVSWEAAQAFCTKLSQKIGADVCLPTEAEWEYACRAGTTTRYFFGDDVIDANLSTFVIRPTDKPSVLHPVGRVRPNPWMLCDMIGNGGQWCADWYGDTYYKDSPAIDPLGPGEPADETKKCRLLAVYCGWVPAFCWAHGQSEVSVTALGASSGSEFVGALAEISGCHEAALRILSHCQFGG